MTRRRFLMAVGLASGLGLIGVVALLLLPPGQGVTKSNYDRIQAGWTEDQVVALLGNEAFYDPRPGDEGIRKSWSGDKGLLIDIVFHDGRVVDKEFGVVINTGFVRETLWDSMRRWVGL